jgi:hypothetical protein
MGKQYQSHSYLSKGMASMLTTFFVRPVVVIGELLEEGLLDAWREGRSDGARRGEDVEDWDHWPLDCWLLGLIVLLRAILFN